MRDRPRPVDAFWRWGRRLRRVERRELREFRRWLEQTRNLIHLSILVLVPLLIALVTFLANHFDPLSYLLFPPLASGTYQLFVNPEGRFASPQRFIGGVTIGAVCGLVAVEVGSMVAGTPTATIGTSAASAALAVFLTGAVTWPLRLEEPSAFSTALLSLLVPAELRTAYVVSIVMASSLVAIVFYVWREHFYEQRASFLYESTKGDDHVLVPMRGENPDETAMLGARIAAAHEAGKVVLLDVVDDADVARIERRLLDRHERSERGLADRARVPAERQRSDGGRLDASSVNSGDEGDGDSDDADAQTDVTEEYALAEAVSTLEKRADDIETQTGVPCEIAVAVSGPSCGRTVLNTARETNCDLIAAAYEERHGSLSPFIYDLFRGDTDVIVHRSQSGRTRWSRIMVPVRSTSDVAHSMFDFALRLAGRSGRISLATVISRDRDRRHAEGMLADLVDAYDPFEAHVETRVALSNVETFLTENAPQYDLLFLGASRDRSAASRLVSPPTFERIQNIDADVAIVDRS